MAKLLENKVMCRQKRLAFTILEILVALSMLVLVLGAVYGSYKAVTESTARCKPRSILEQQARLFLQRLTQQIRCCYAGRSNGSVESSLKRLTEKEVLRQENPSLFVGKDASSGETFLRFVTSAATPGGKHRLGGLAIVSYRLDESGTTLLCSVRRYLDRLENDNDGYDWHPVFGNVETIVLEYFDGEQWLEEWDSNERKCLPQAVSISLVLETEDTGPLSFVSAAHIVCREAQIDRTTVQRTAPQGPPKGQKP